MNERMLQYDSGRLTMENYKFSGLDNTRIGAIKSVADYYQIPLSVSWIYGMTGMAFLHVLDEDLVKFNSGPADTDIYRIARNIGIEVEGIHEAAEGDAFQDLQRKAWEKAGNAFKAGEPVFVKNLDIENQVSVVPAIDDQGYYIQSWHVGPDSGNNRIGWQELGLSQCPCVDCVNERNGMVEGRAASGLISIHSARPTPAIDSREALVQALEYAIRINNKTVYEQDGIMYYSGAGAYRHWITQLKDEKINRYFFSLFLEIVSEARVNASKFLEEIKLIANDIPVQLLDRGIDIYDEIASRYKVLKDKFPYSQPKEPLRDPDQLRTTLAIMTEIANLENDAEKFLSELYAALTSDK